MVTVGPMFKADSKLVTKVAPCATTGFKPGRTTGAPTMLIIHSAETPETMTAAEGVLAYFAGGSGGRAAGAHYVIDPDTIGQSIPESATAYGVVGYNPEAIHIEIAGKAGQTTAQWVDDYSTKCNLHVIDLAADILTRNPAIPFRWLTVDMLIADIRADHVSAGITSHANCTAARKACGLSQTGHTDPGAGYPYEYVMHAIGVKLTPPAPVVALDGYPIMGPALTTVDKAVAAFVAHGAVDDAPDGYSIVSVRTIIEEYVRIGDLVGVSAAAALGQLIHETGPDEPGEVGWLKSWWVRRIPGMVGRRNPAGLKVTGEHWATEAQASAALHGDKLAYAWNPIRKNPDGSHGRWERGLGFVAWEGSGGSVAAHYGRLIDYATIPANRTPAQAALVAQAVARMGSLPPELVGSAPTIRQLGAANNPSGEGWAVPGTDYGARIGSNIRLLV